MQISVCITYVDMTRTSNNESGPSSVITVGANAAVVISIASLIPPNSVFPQIGSAEGYQSSLTATHWNVYASAFGSLLRLQNSIPIPIAVKTATLNLPLSTGTRVLGPGQYADRNAFFMHMALRA